MLTSKLNAGVGFDMLETCRFKNSVSGYSLLKAHGFSFFGADIVDVLLKWSRIKLTG